MAATLLSMRVELKLMPLVFKPIAAALFCVIAVTAPMLFAFAAILFAFAAIPFVLVPIAAALFCVRAVLAPMLLTLVPIWAVSVSYTHLTLPTTPYV